MDLIYLSTTYPRLKEALTALDATAERVIKESWLESELWIFQGFRVQFLDALTLKLVLQNRTLGL